MSSRVSHHCSVIIEDQCLYILGIVRLPMNLIRGWRSAARRTLVANMVEM